MRKPGPSTRAMKPKPPLSLAALWHLASYVVVGVFSAAVNLLCFQFVYAVVRLPRVEQERYIVAYLISAEVATMFNFIFNDRFTFANSSGRFRPWPVRCLRFHTTVFNGLVLTFVVSSLLHYGLSLPAFIGQAGGILVAFVFNFVVHHLWTYRARSAGAKQ